MAQILVTGGTGTVGRQLVRQLSYQGFDAAILSRRTHVDLPSGAKIFVGDIRRLDSIRAAVRDAAIIIHCASNPRDANSVDVEGTHNLIVSANEKKLQHLVYLSIAGVDRSAYPYYQAKYEAEKMIEDCPLPWSILRATQFHDFVLHRLIKPADNRDGSSLRIPKDLKFQSIDVSDVALRLLNLAMASPLRCTVTIGGPEILTLGEMARAYLTAENRNEDIEAAKDQGGLHNVFRSGINVNPEWAWGKISWEAFLKARF